ncbi:hypothetical protein [Asticcacaulis sp. 201]|uniref:hypothetical protein n=1 Tax=Asticcacaulis sp. 201 TaxID=3028787 RepID=UPI0029164B51|nr:hypothetical protein [Asticcacaulis sp. 201]MDV6331818.1 hypothetical protein [Asticcacaulis sp. 201]
MPRRLEIAGWVMIAALWLAIGLQYFTGIETVKLVKTVFYFVVLEYIWASVKREFFPNLR